MPTESFFFILGVWGSKCLRWMLSNLSQTFASIRSDSHPFATICNSFQACASRKFYKKIHFWRVHVSRTWHGWHFLTCEHVWWHVGNDFSWQARNCFDIFRQCVAFGVGGPAVWTYPISFSMPDLCFFSKIALAELVEECKLHARVALFDMCCNLGAASQYLCGKLQNLRLGRSYCPKSLKKITKPELFQVVEGLPGNVRFQAPTYNTLTLWFPKGFAISTREKKKMKLFQMYPNAKIGQNVRETICSSVLTCLILTFWF